MRFLDDRPGSCSSPARAASARPPSPAPPPSPSPSRAGGCCWSAPTRPPTSARSSASTIGNTITADPRRARPVGAGDRPGAGGRRLPRAHHRPGPRAAARTRDRLDHRAAVRLLHHRDRLVQRVHRPARRPGVVRRSTTTSCSTPPPPATPSGCCSCPGSWTDFLNAGKGDASCLGPLAGLDKQRAIYADAVAALKDPARTRLVLVARAQALRPGRDRPHQRELAQIGIRATHSSSTASCPTTAGDEDLAVAVRGPRAGGARRAARRARRACRVDVIELKAANMVGLPALARCSTTPPLQATQPAEPLRCRRCRTRRSARWSTRSSAAATAWSCAWARAASARPPSPPRSPSPWPSAATRCT